MHAAVVTEFGTAPSLSSFAEPVATSADQLVVEVLAAGLHPLVRSRASGAHYSSEGVLPLVPGTDGVGRDADGQLHYFQTRSALGSMAQRTVMDIRTSVALPADVDPVAIAATMNPAMSSWVALRRRIAFRPGQRVLVLGATGAAGRAAVQVAGLLGAESIVAVGRNATLLAGPDVSRTVVLDEPAELADAASQVDVVLDYLWGEPAATVLRAAAPARHDSGRPLTWVAIGSTAGPDALVPSAVLRSAPVTMVGSGIGSVSVTDFVAELPDLVAAVHRGDIRVPARPMPLARVTEAWADAATSRDRIVLVP